MDIQDIRRNVLRSLIRAAHGDVVRQFALHIKKSDGQINDMLAIPPRKAFGERVARSIEKAYPLPPGFLDDPKNISEEIPANLMATVLAACESPPIAGYGTLNRTVAEVVELMQSVDEEAQRDILGAARATASEYRLKHQNSTKRAVQ